MVRRGSSLTSQLGLSERVFSSAEDRGMARAVDDGLARVESTLLQEVRFADSIADVTGRYLLDAGGKRVRPMLTLLTAQLGEGGLPEVVQAAAAIEITHLGSLYHDDVMDEAERRRGVPSAQTVWGNSVAILTGDLLFARASQIMAALGERAIRLQANTFERLVLGQLHETVGPQPGDDAIAHYLAVLADKTGSLIATAGQAGIVFSHAPAEFEQAVVDFGERVGIAFQLIDDVLDLSARTEETGKTSGTDIRAGVVTLPLLKLRQRALTDASSAALLARIESHVSVDRDDDADPLDLDEAIAELRDHEVTRETFDEAHRWARDAVAALEPIPDGSVKKALSRFADTIVERSS